MIVEVTPEQVYGGVVTLLLILQAWHHYRLTKHIQKTENQTNQLWSQIALLTTSVAFKLTELEKKTDSKVGNQEKTN